VRHYGHFIDDLKLGKLIVIGDVDHDSRTAGERLRVTAALRESEARFRIITEAMPQMVWSNRPDGYNDYHNEQWHGFTGAPRNATDGHRWSEMFHRTTARGRGNCGSTACAPARPTKSSTGCATTAAPTAGCWAARCRCATTTAAHALARHLHRHRQPEARRGNPARSQWPQGRIPGHAGA